MAVEALRIDGDDLDLDLLPAIQQSFGLRLEQEDVKHVRTIGDLHTLILSKQPGVSGAACGTMLVIHLPRRALAAHGVDRRAGSALVLGEQGLPPPERLRSELAAATGLEMPARVVGGWCLLALGFFVLLPVAGWTTGRVWLALAMPPVCWLLARNDKGRWSGEWVTLGSLARATAALNHAALARRGARHSPAAVWNSLRNLLAGYGLGTRDIGPDTWLTAPPPSSA